MKTIKLEQNTTGWVSMSAKVTTIVVHFSDGHREKMSFGEFVMMPKRKSKKAVQLDCYEKGEIVPTINDSTKCNS